MLLIDYHVQCIVSFVQDFVAVDLFLFDDASFVQLYHNSQSFMGVQVSICTKILSIFQGSTSVYLYHCSFNLSWQFKCSVPSVLHLLSVSKFSPAFDNFILIGQ